MIFPKKKCDNCGYPSEFFHTATTKKLSYTLCSECLLIIPPNFHNKDTDESDWSPEFMLMYLKLKRVKNQQLR